MKNRKKLSEDKQVQGENTLEKQTIPKKDWPIGHLPDSQTEQVIEEAPADEQRVRLEPLKDKGFDDLSVSWP